MGKNSLRLLILVPVTTVLAFATIEPAKSQPMGDMNGMRMAPATTATGATVGGAFTLTDQNGKTITDKDFNGQYRLIYFGFTSCPDVCPLTLREMTDALKLLDPATAAKVTPVFITVDPERDTPAVLKSYVSSFSPRLVGLTGTIKQVQEVENGYKVYAAKASSPSGSDYTTNHSAFIYLMGPDGKFIDVVDPSDQKTEGIAAWLKKRL